MAEDQPEFIRFAGRVAFPRGPQDLVGTSHCPACFAPVRSTICTTCGLDLGHPATAELHDASVLAADALEKRLAIIGRIRFDTAQALTAAPAAAVVSTSAPVVEPSVTIPAPATPAPVVSAPVVSAPANSSPPPPAPAGQPSVAGAQPPRRSSVQVTLLIVGVSLLSVAAIFFLVYAFINFGIVWRSVIIGSITVAALVTASLLRKHNLNATAEGIAAFGVVLVYLDVYAVRANNLFGAEAADGAIYWGSALILSALGFIAWQRMSGLRIPNIAGFTTVAPGVGVLVSGLTEPIADDLQPYLVVASIAAAGLVHAFLPRATRAATLERAIVLSTTALAALAAMLFAFGLGLSSTPSADWAPALGVLGIGAVAALHVIVLHRSKDQALNRAFAGVLSGLAAVAAAAAVGYSAIRLDDGPFLLVAPAVAAVVVALALETSARLVRSAPVHEAVAANRQGTADITTVEQSAPDVPAPKGPAQERPEFWGRNLTVAAWSAAAVAGLTLLAPATIAALSAVFAAVGTDAPRWSFQLGDPVTRWSSDSAWAVAALAIVTATATLVWALTGRLRARAVVVAAAAAATIIVAIPELRVQVLVAGAWLLLGVAALVGLLMSRHRHAIFRRFGPVLTATLIASIALGYLLGWETVPTWWMATAAVVAVLLACRMLFSATAGRAALLGAAVAFAILSSGVVADLVTRQSGNTTIVQWADVLVLTGLAAVTVLVFSAVRTPLATALDRRVLAWTSGAFAAGALVLSTPMVTSLPQDERNALLFPEFATSLVVALAALAALTLWMLLRANHTLRIERIAASIALGPALYLVLTAFARVLELQQLISGVAPITAALFAAAGALAIATLRPSTTPRWAREIGVALVGIPTVAFAVMIEDPLAWVVLLIAAVATLLLATDAGGLFSSTSGRRQLGWLALALATAGLWSRLDGERVTDLAAYLVPLTVALIVVAVFIQRAAARATPPQDSRVAPLVILAGLLVSLVPLGVNESSGPALGFGVLFATAVLLLIGGSVLTGARAVQWTADAMAASGAAAVIVMAGTRGAFLPVTSAERDAWLAAAFLALVIAAFLQTRPHTTGSAKTRATVGQWLAIAALTLVLAVESASFGESTGGSVRAAAVIMVFAAIHLIAYLVNRLPLSHAIAWVAIGFAALAGAIAYATDALHPVELASIPIAIALVVTAAHHLAANPHARSWARLGPATAVLLAPSLVVTLFGNSSDAHALWRLVGLGVVGIAVLVIGLVKRLQAPFVLGVVVVLWHGIATFLPQLRAAYEFFPWWLWLGVGGVLLITLAARYERRIRDLKSAVSHFTSLR